MGFSTSTWGPVRGPVAPSFAASLEVAVITMDAAASAITSAPTLVVCSSRSRICVAHTPLSALRSRLTGGRLLQKLHCMPTRLQGSTARHNTLAICARQPICPCKVLRL